MMQEAYDPFNAKVSKKKATKPLAEPTISISIAGGEETPPVPMSVMKAAVESIKGVEKPAIRKTAPMREEGAAVGTVAAGELRAFIERIERVLEDKKALSDDEKQIYAELKGSGFDTKAVRTIIRMRKKETHERQEEEAMLNLYMSALGMPLFGEI